MTELYLLSRMSNRVGFITTLTLVVCTGALGATLARKQGLGVMRRVQADLAAGRMPGAAMIDGIIILLAGAVLITPGILTDAFGFLCLVPSFREVIRKRIFGYLQNAAQEGNVQFFGDPSSPWPSGYVPSDQEGPIIDVEVKPKEPPKD